MANTTPIDVQTEARRIPLDPQTDLDKRLKQLANVMGSAGYQICSTFVAGTELVVVFQLTREE